MLRHSCLVTVLAGSTLISGCGLTTLDSAGLGGSDPGLEADSSNGDGAVAIDSGGVTDAAIDTTSPSSDTGSPGVDSTVSPTDGTTPVDSGAAITDSGVDTRPTDSGVDTRSTDTAPGVDACPALTTNCSGTCAYLPTDPFNCGSCGTKCAIGGWCAGSCVCVVGQKACGGRCIDILSDFNNCGDCGHRCDGGETCRTGSCTG